MLANRSKTEQTLAVVLALVRFWDCCYRATHQSIVVDEALTFNRFVKGPWSSIYADYDANNHVLYSILAKLSVGVFGPSEFTLRLPSLLAGLFLSLGIFWLLQEARSWLIRWVTLLTICLHPLLLDFSIAARGYSLSLALFIWAVYFSVRGRRALPGALLGLASSASLATAFPALGLMLAVVLLEYGSVARRLRSLLAMAVPAGALFFVICFLPLRSAHREDFYAGYSTFFEAIFSIVYTSIHAKVNAPGLFGTDQAASMIAMFLLPSLTLTILAASGRDLLHSGVRHRAIPLLALMATVVGLIGAHYLFRLKYPPDRACLYLVLLFGTAWAISADGVQNEPLLAANLVLAGLLALQFASQSQTRYFQYWTVDMDTRTIARILKRECAGKPGNTIAVSTTWVHQPALEFYREYFRITALRPIERREPTPLRDHDFYVLSGSDTREIEGSRWRVLFANPLSGVVLASRP